MVTIDSLGIVAFSIGLVLLYSQSRRSGAFSGYRLTAVSRDKPQEDQKEE
jgi:hypothetical protein